MQKEKGELIQLIQSELKSASLYGGNAVNHNGKETYPAGAVPFYSKGRLSFIIDKYRCSTALSRETLSDSFAIICRDDDGEHNTVLFDFKGAPAYEIDYSIAEYTSVKDDYASDVIASVIMVSIVAKCNLKYPLRGPDFGVRMMLELELPNKGQPSVKLIDYLNMHIVTSKAEEGKRIIDSAWGCDIEKRCQEKIIEGAVLTLLHHS